MNQYLSPFYDTWSFLRTELDTTLADIQGRKEDFAPVELPHDWLIYNAKDLYQNGYGWYRKEFDLEKAPADGERLILRFEGVYMNSTLYVNGREIGDWKYGYSTFDMDITDAVTEGRNEVIVQVRHQSPNSRWYSGAGIYRKVWMKRCGRAYLPLDGTYVVIRPAEGVEGDFILEAETELGGPDWENTECHYTLWQGEGLVKDFGIQQWQRPAGERPKGEYGTEDFAPGMAGIKTNVTSPKLWDIEDPQCYRLKVQLRDKNSGEELDIQDITVGFRHYEFDREKGFFLNGRHVKIHGVCEHHDLGCLGAAFHAPAFERKLRVLKEMGCNAIRTSHNMPAPELMDLADKMGFLIVDEAFDMWERPKTDYDYGRFFKEWCPMDVRSWVRRDRNHPCLLMWSIGNEIYDTHADEHGQEITRRLQSMVKFHDPRENGLVTIGSNYMAWEGAQKCAEILKVAGYNYGEQLYEAQHKEHPDWIMYGSETASLVHSRGIYRFPLSQSVLSDDDEQCSSLGNCCTSWGAKSWEYCILDDRDCEFILGQFLWTGFDYIGEPTPYHTKNSYFGQIDTAGFPKDPYYFFQAQWTDVEKAPMVHLFPYWDFNPGQKVDVRACTNAPEVELFVNGVSQGRRQIDRVHGRKLVADWQLEYTPGTITAVAYDKEGREVARDSRTSFGDSSRIALAVDKTKLRADGTDMCFVTVETLDAQGNKVENASDYVEVTLEGPGRVLGMDNGDSTDYDDYKTNVRKLFSGKLLVVVGTTGEPGEIKVRISGKGLESAELTLQAVEAGGAVQTYLEDCRKLATSKQGLPERIPVRKAELRAVNGRSITGQVRELTVEAVLQPADTTDREVVWRAVNQAGIPVSFAKVEPIESADGRQLARVTALGDGDFLVRCMVKGGGRTVLISQLEYKAEGIGQAFLNPYEFVTGGLYTRAYGQLGNGNEKGVASDRGNVSGPVYDNVDFGEFGSDELTMPIFALDGSPYDIDIWQGMPNEEGSRIVASVVYQKPSIWNTYQEETFKLPERIKGMTTIAFTLRDKVHIKGFVFKKLEKAFEQLWAEDASAVYGDSFRRDGRAVRGIGNNVVLAYEDMDFGEKGASELTICGGTALSGNTIHLHFTDEAGVTTNHILEFAGTEGTCREQTFALEGLKGKGKIELIFLPGSSFDLEYMKFGRS
ncbi:MAG: DUF4982 domain-containing protein [Acetatifactor sp.]|nr:DUF4982 domain-containing protein [Acetatifactor sp.]